ncbi:allantoate amidohydrolase [Mumia sp. Pv 4-285]|uniref:allantoate amidohydrolase n=1 Tax=Mumia qirimensis TaxID=3234852 RepID=UPI00351D3D39
MRARDPLADARTALDRCDALATLSAVEGRIDRFSLTPEHAAASTLAASWMHEAGMSTWTDAVGNVCGRLEGATPGLPALLLGSHLDTVPDAGRYDGPLGVVVAVAVAERLRDRRASLPFALEVVGFSDEEGARFGAALTGSRGLAGTWDQSWWEQRDADGTTLREAFARFGLDPARAGDAARDPGSLVGYLESHIEQGSYLEAADLPLGVVRSIAGARRFTLSVVGEARHAGGTPYDRRRDALVGASHAVIDVERIARAEGVVATVGSMQVHPGAVNVVPGRADFTLDLRAERDVDRDRAWDLIADAIEKRCAERGLAFEATETHRAPAVEMDPHLRDAIATGVRATTGQDAPMVLTSLAGHDAMAIATVTPVAMQFVRCRDGVSHHPDESVRVDDVGAAIDAFEAAVLAVAASTVDLATVNAMPGAELAAALTRCADVPRWVEAVVTARPYESVAALLQHADAAAATWTDEEVDHALAQHPRIGERSRRPAAEAAMSAREQSRVATDDDVAARLQAGNAAYEKRFDRVFLVRAAGRDAEEILALLEDRLGNDDATEREVVRAELREIATLRLQSVVAALRTGKDGA